MTEAELYKKLNVVFRDIFDDETISITDKTSPADISDWDSLAHVSLIVSIEKTFGVKFKIDEMMKFKCVSDIANAVMGLNN